MLDPDDRCLLSEQVLPPHGYAFTDALICTYTLDLTALGGVPLALLQSDPLALGDAAGERLEALRAVREVAKRLSGFCQAGAMLVPTEWRDAFLWLEASVVQVRPTAARAVFHPKLWLLRFANDAGDAHYRLLVLSRNLTYDRSWDVIARLEGAVISRQKAIRANAPLVQFVEALGTEAAIPAVGGLADAHRERCDRVARELRTVRFEAQDERVHGWAFWPLGIPGHQYPLAQLFDGRRSPFQAWAEGAHRAGRRLLVVSPFLSGSIVKTLSDCDFPVSLVSRDDALDEQFEVLPEHWFPEEVTRVHSFRQELSLEGVPLSGLHAKLWVADDGWDAHLWAGSANATGAAFTRNVEFLLQLSGPRSLMGIDTLLGDKGLEPLISPYLRPSQALDEALLTLKRQQEALDWLLIGLVTEEKLAARIEPTGDSVWALTLKMLAEHPLQVEGLQVRWRARPISVPWSRVGSVEEGGPPCRCADLALHELTEFWTLALEVPGTELQAETTVRLRAEGEWPEFTSRESAALSRHLRDADSLALYLEFMLAGDDEGLRQRLRHQRQQGLGGGRHTSAPLRPLFETLLQACAERPQALAEVVDLIESSRDSGLMQDEAFRTLWAAFRDVQTRLLSA